MNTPHLIRTHTRRCHSRGAAMVEAVATLPVFILLFVGIFFLRDGMVESQELDTKARSCAWRYSRNACTVVPDGCEGFVGTGKSAPEGTDAVETIQEAFGGVKNAAASSNANGRTFVEKAATQIIQPFISEFFDKAAVANTAGIVERPPLFGGGTVQIEGHYRLACDLAERKPLDIALEAWGLRK